MAPVVAAAIIGAGANLAGTAAQMYGAYKDRQAAAERRDLANQQIGSWENEANKILEDAMAGNVSLSSPSDLATYQQLKQAYNPLAYVYDTDPFDKSKYNVEDYLNPNRKRILDEVTRTISHRMGGQGLGHSYGAAEAIGEGILAKDEELYDKAFERMQAERNFDYGMYTDYINQQQQRLNALQQGVLTQMQNLRGDITFDQQQQDAYLANKLDLGNTLAQTRASLV